MTEPIQEFPIRRYRQGQITEVADRVAVEEPLEIRLAGEPFQVLMRLPGMEKELAAGFLYTEGIIRNLADITTLHFCGTATDPLLPPNVVDVILTPEAQARTGRRHLQVAYSSCSLCAKETVAEISRATPPVSSDLTIAPPTLLALMARLAATQTVFQETGGTHGVALSSPDGQVFIAAEDIGRHNAMDKAIGRALMERRDLTRMVALLSGRISFEMALKAVRAGIPILAAISAATSMALTLAREMNLTLAGFVRGSSMNVYTHPQRIRG
ncbi:MAG: formate dehydrogenase accessory sulfurtransferase FdhD [Thermodesulfobacteriota bacterium]